MRRSRLALAVVVGTGASSVAGFWLGSDGAFPFAASRWSVVAVAGCIAGFAASAAKLGPPSKRWVTAIAATTLGLGAASVGAWRGELAFRRAYEECIERGDTIRVALRDHRRAHGRFPTRLADLEAPLPCAIPLRGTLVRYRRVDAGYRIAFGDWLVECSGSEREPLACRK